MFENSSLNYVIFSNNLCVYIPYITSYSLRTDCSLKCMKYKHTNYVRFYLYIYKKFHTWQSTVCVQTVVCIVWNINDIVIHINYSNSPFIVLTFQTTICVQTVIDNVLKNIVCTFVILPGSNMLFRYHTSTSCGTRWNSVQMVSVVNNQTI